MVKNSKKGFSIIEILITLVLIAIISVVAFLVFWNQAIKARNSMRLDTSSKIADAMRLYKFDNTHYPSEGKNNVTIWYYDSDPITGAWFQKYSAGDILMLKNSDFDETVGSGSIKKYMPRIVWDPASKYWKELKLRYGVDYTGYCNAGVPCSDSKENLEGSAFEVGTVLENEDGTYMNHIVGDLSANEYSVTFK